LDSCSHHGAGRAQPITFSLDNAFAAFWQVCLAIHLSTPALYPLSSEHIFLPNREKHQQKSLLRNAAKSAWIKHQMWKAKS
jgi:hypothetical protein